MIGYKEIRKASDEVVALGEEHGDMQEALLHMGVDSGAVSQVALELTGVALTTGGMSPMGYIMMGFLVGLQVER